MLLDFTTERGGKVYVNPDDVQSLSWCRGSIGMSPAVTIIKMRDGSRHEVIDDQEGVARRINEAMSKGAE